MNKYEYIFIIFLLLLNTSVFSQATREETINQSAGTNIQTQEGNCEWCERSVGVYVLSYTVPDFTNTSDEGLIGEDTFTYMFNGYGTEFEGKMSENQITGS